MHQVVKRLTGKITGGWDMTFTAGSFAVSDVARTGGVPGFASGKQKQHAAYHCDNQSPAVSRLLIECQRFPPDEKCSYQHTPYL